MSTGILHLLPAPLNQEYQPVQIPQECLDVLKTCKHFITEERKSTIRYLKQAVPGITLPDLHFHELNEHTQDIEVEELIAPLLQGEDMALLSEAGLPCVADPGSRMVSLAQRKGIRVRPYTGPSSLYLALMASGFNGQHFTFHGYLPRKPEERKSAIQRIEKDLQRNGYTQIFIEAPYRSNQLLQALIATLNPETYICVACEILGEQEWIVTQSAQQWKKMKKEIGKQNCVFLMGRPQ